MVRPIAKAVLLVLVLFVAAPSLQAAGPREAARSAPSGSPTLVAFLVELWDSLTSAWIDNGCEVDPDGRCRR